MENIKDEVRKFMKERDWLNQPASDVAKSIVIEAAELLEHFQWNSFFAEEVEKDHELKQEIVKELADVFIYAIEMAIVLDVDIADIVHQKLLAAAKKYPVGVVNGKLGSKRYKEIKKEYRKNN
ncbi:MAG: nucleotide pyrophosphohydrolase [Patescibacteria group bacterium]|nr:nucleotide pyrophosphohydrolase [Patescibacteria group bacterium]